MGFLHTWSATGQQICTEQIKYFSFNFYLAHFLASAKKSDKLHYNDYQSHSCSCVNN